MGIGQGKVGEHAGRCRVESQDLAGLRIGQIEIGDTFSLHPHDVVELFSGGQLFFVIGDFFESFFRGAALKDAAVYDEILPVLQLGILLHRKRFGILDLLVCDLGQTGVFQPLTLFVFGVDEVEVFPKLLMQRNHLFRLGLREVRLAGQIGVVVGLLFLCGKQCVHIEFRTLEPVRILQPVGALGREADEVRHSLLYLPVLFSGFGPQFAVLPEDRMGVGHQKFPRAVIIRNGEELCELILDIAQ